MKFKILSLYLLCHVATKIVVAVLSLNPKMRIINNTNGKFKNSYLPFTMLIDKDKDTNEYWRETEILSVIRNGEVEVDYDKCEETPTSSLLQLPTRRTVRPICKNRLDYQLCPQCPHFSNHTECELFRDSCRERKVLPSEYHDYCDKKYGRWRAMFIPADYSQCRCCDECIFYRELDQSCIQDVYNFDTEEFLPVTSIDFRAGCNPYTGHPEQEFKALRCDNTVRRCVPVLKPSLPNESLNFRQNYRYEPVSSDDCPVTCRGYECRPTFVPESKCVPGAFLPDREQCNCCGTCSPYQQLNQKCAEYKKTVHYENGTKEIEIEEEFLEPGCDDGLVCRHGRCQDIHIVQMRVGSPMRNEEPCKRELKLFKKKYGPDGHLHFEAPQCTPLWLYAPVQCRRFVCYCALEDGSIIQGIKVPRVEVSNMNCGLPQCYALRGVLSISRHAGQAGWRLFARASFDICQGVPHADCAREKCRTKSDIECDGYGNYKEAIFVPQVEEWGGPQETDDGCTSVDNNLQNAEETLPSSTLG